MKDAFNRFLGRRSAMSLYTLPAPAGQQSQIVSARKQFEIARQGDKCRTLSFANVTGDSEWYAGQQDPLTGQWAIRKYQELPNIAGNAAAVGEPALKIKTLKDGLNFFDAISELSVYERGQLASGVIPANDTASLGDTHFIIFAEREGVLFDTDGAPHPTLNGEIVTDGTFTKAAVERARAYSRKHSLYFAQGGNDVLQKLIEPTIQADKVFTEALKKSADFSRLEALIEHVEDMAVLIECLFEKKLFVDPKINVLRESKQYFSQTIDYESLYGNRSKDHKALNKANGIMDRVQQYNCESAFRELVLKAQRTAEYLPMDQYNIDALKQGIASIDLYFKLLSARYLISLQRSGADNYAETALKMESAVSSYESQFKKLGGSDDDLWKVKSLILDPNQPSTQPAIKAFANQLKAFKEQAEHDLKRLKNVAVAGPYEIRPPQ